jgi:hypothetical protein
MGQAGRQKEGDNKSASGEANLPFEGLATKLTCTPLILILLSILLWRIQRPSAPGRRQNYWVYLFANYFKGDHFRAP